MQDGKIEVADQETGASCSVVDRRRPGRLEVAPELVTLLREPAVGPGIGDEQDLAYYAGDDVLAPASGIVYGLMLALPLWAAIVAAVYAFL